MTASAVRRSGLALALSLAAAFAGACGSDSNGGTGTNTPDSGVTETPEAGTSPGDGGQGPDGSIGPTDGGSTADGGTTDGGHPLEAGTDGGVQPPPPPQDLAKYVDPLIGTGLALTDGGAISGGQGGSVFPGADVPFGRVQWSPDTPNGEPSGYVYSDTAFTGFSLTHFSGAGCPNNGDIPILPVLSASETSVGFAHADEHATAGYYDVKTSEGVRVELTATQRAGVGRFTFPAAGGTLLVDASRNSAYNPIGTITVSGTSLDGTTGSGHFCGSSNFTNLYFHAEVDQPFTTTAAAGAGKVALTFAAGTGPVTMKIAISYVSGANAKANLQAEVGSQSFDAIHTAATAAWNARLNAIQVSGGSDDEKTKFYTALYHALLHPNVFSDVNGDYVGFDKTTHNAKGRVQYANYSGWDIYRSEIQLLALLYPEVAGDMLQSLVDDAQQCGYFIMWSQNNADDTVMVGDPGALIMANGYAFGATNFDQKTTLSILTKPPSANYSCSNPVVFAPGSPYVYAGYLTDGYYPASASSTLEMSTRDFAVAEYAAAQGDMSHARVFLQRAGAWRYLITPNAGGAPSLQARLSTGAWKTPLMTP
ncbi:MAG TPA: GH92 family glycosyl hydrolase, partial [Polyangiaceae bacterium]